MIREKQDELFAALAEWREGVAGLREAVAAGVGREALLTMLDTVSGKATDITERRGIEARTCAWVVAWAERVGLPGVRCRAELWGEYGFSPRYTEFRRVQVWVNYSFSSLATLDVRCLPSEVEATVEEFLTRLPTIVAASIREAVERHRANVAEILANAEKREREAAKDRARHAEIIAKCAPEWAEDLARADRVEASTV